MKHGVEVGLVEEKEIDQGRNDRYVSVSSCQPVQSADASRLF